MKYIPISLLALVLLSAPGCKEGGNNMVSSEAVSAPAYSSDLTAKSVDATESSPTPETATSIERKIIKTATLRYRAGNIDKTRKTVDKAIKGMDGYIINENNTYDEFMQEQYMEIKIPAQYLDSFITVISSTAKKWETKSISASDVTEEYIDITARLHTKKELEARYLELLKRSGSVTEVLSVEPELATVRGEIESMEGRIKYLNTQVAYSTVNLSYFVPVRGPVGFFGRMFEGFVDGWRALLECLIGLMKNWPFVLLFGGLAWWLIKLRRKRRAG